MRVDIRQPSADEFETAVRTIEAAFAEEPGEGDMDRLRAVMPVDRILCALDGVPIGTAASFPFELTVPGGLARAAGVTWVGVLPSHRRRGVMTQLMRRQLDDVHERGEPLAVLWASESSIYGRFGYGMSAPEWRIAADRARFRFRDDPGPVGTVRLVSAEEAAETFAPVYDRIRRDVPGMFARSPEWWTHMRTADPPHWRNGAGPRFFAAYTHDGEVEGYAIYHVKNNWENGIPQSDLLVSEAAAVSPIAEREVWRFLFGIDLIARVKSRLDPASPLALLVADPRGLHRTVADGLWLRLVDVEAALRARGYATDDRVVVEVRDEVCPWNAGRYRVGSDVARTDEDPGLSLDVADLACAYLGAYDFHALARAQRVRELRPGALERVTLLFRTQRPPFCPEVF